MFSTCTWIGWRKPTRVLVVLGLLGTIAVSCGRSSGKTTVEAQQVSEAAPASQAPTASPAPSFDLKSFQPQAPAGWHYSHTFHEEGITLVSYESDIQDQKDLAGRPAGRTLTINLIDATGTKFAQSDPGAELDEYLALPSPMNLEKRSESRSSIAGMPAASWVDFGGPFPIAEVVIAINANQLIEVLSPNETVETVTGFASQVVGR